MLKLAGTYTWWTVNNIKEKDPELLQLVRGKTKLETPDPDGYFFLTSLTVQIVLFSSISKERMNEWICTISPIACTREAWEKMKLSAMNTKTISSILMDKKTFYRSSAGSHFYWRANDIWTDFRLVSKTEKRNIMSNS